MGIKINIDFSETNIKKQLTENLQLYFNQYGLSEKAKVDIEVAGTGTLTVKVHTNELLGYGHLKMISALIWSLMPPGIMHELVNVVIAPGYGEAKLVPDGIEFKTSVKPESLPVEALSKKKK